MVIGGSRDRNVPTIGVSASKTTYRQDIPVPLLKFQVLLPHLTLKSPFSLLNRAPGGCEFANGFYIQSDAFFQHQSYLFLCQGLGPAGEFLKSSMQVPLFACTMLLSQL